MDTYAVRAGAQHRQDPHLWDDSPSTREIGLSISPKTGKSLYKIGFSTVSLGHQYMQIMNNVSSQ